MEQGDYVPPLPPTREGGPVRGEPVRATCTSPACSAGARTSRRMYGPRGGAALPRFPGCTAAGRRRVIGDGHPAYDTQGVSGDQATDPLCVKGPLHVFPAICGFFFRSASGLYRRRRPSRGPTPPPTPPTCRGRAGPLRRARCADRQARAPVADRAPADPQPPRRGPRAGSRSTEHGGRRVGSPGRSCRPRRPRS
jgi:hypothetical protein